MKIPEFIYKYQSLNVNNLTALNTGQLWFSNLFALNDPFEATYEFTPELIFGNTSNVSSVDDTVTKIIKNSAICSFTKVCPTDPRQFKTNTLMWSHYAGQFSGICIEFKTEALLSSLQDDSRFTIKAEDVKYTDIIHSYNTPVEAFGNDVMFKKHSAWEYEKEFRILCQKYPFSGESNYQAEGLHGYDPRAITNVFVGGRLTLDQQKLLRVIITDLNPEVEIVPLSTSNKYAYGFECFDYGDDY